MLVDYSCALLTDYISMLEGKGISQSKRLRNHTFNLKLQWKSLKPIQD